MDLLAGFLDKVLVPFAKGLPSRTFDWLLAVVCCLIIRRESCGLASMTRELAEGGRGYECLDAFFHADSWSADGVAGCWIGQVRVLAPMRAVECGDGGRHVLVVDTTVVERTGARMPGVAWRRGKSESGGAMLVRGQLVTMVGVIVGEDPATQCVPLAVSLEGVGRATEGMESAAFGRLEDPATGRSSVARGIDALARCAHKIGPSVAVGDRAYMSRVVYRELEEKTAATPDGRRELELVTRAKRNCVAYLDPPPRTPGKRGPKRRKGQKIPLRHLFRGRRKWFRRMKVHIYGRDEIVRVCCRDLLWGAGLYRKLRFVLVKMAGGGQLILACTDLDMDPEAIIEAYALRFRIEDTFKDMKHVVPGLDCRFWSKSQPEFKSCSRKAAPPPADLVEDPDGRKGICAAVEATDRYMTLACVALGVLQLFAVLHGDKTDARSLRWQRTPCAPGTISIGALVDWCRRNLPALLATKSGFIVGRRIGRLRKRLSDPPVRHCTGKRRTA